MWYRTKSGNEARSQQEIRFRGPLSRLAGFLARRVPGWAGDGVDAGPEALPAECRGMYERLVVDIRRAQPGTAAYWIAVSHMQWLADLGDRKAAEFVAQLEVTKVADRVGIRTAQLWLDGVLPGGGTSASSIRELALPAV